MNCTVHTHTQNYTRFNDNIYVYPDYLEHFRALSQVKKSNNTNGVNSLNLIMGCHSSENTTLFNG